MAVEADATATTAAASSGCGGSGGGLVVIKTLTLVLLAVYRAPALAQEVVPLCEFFADSLVERGM